MAKRKSNMEKAKKIFQACFKAWLVYLFGSREYIEEREFRKTEQAEGIKNYLSSISQLTRISDKKKRVVK